MTNDELINAYIEANGLRRQYDDNHIAILTPFLMAGVAYDHFNKHIRPLPARHERKAARTEWIKANGLFFRTFWKNFDDIKQDAVMERLDKLEEYCANDLLILKVAVMNCLKDYPLSTQDVTGDCLVCNALAQYGYSMTRALYDRHARRYDQEYYFCQIMRLSRAYASGYKELPVTETDYAKFEKAATALENRMINWIRTN